jgi:hypothetical protein
MGRGWCRGGHGGGGCTCVLGRGGIVLVRGGVCRCFWTEVLPCLCEEICAVLYTLLYRKGFCPQSSPLVLLFLQFRGSFPLESQGFFFWFVFLPVPPFSSIWGEKVVLVLPVLCKEVEEFQGHLSGVLCVSSGAFKGFNFSLVFLVD